MMLQYAGLPWLGANTMHWCDDSGWYRKHIEKDGAPKRRFQPVYVQPPSVEEAVKIIRD
jgi:ATP-dependent Clp protease ATP-binding subunit ClpA